MPILDSHSLEIISRSTEQTRRVGMRLGALLQPGDLVALVGDLGSGKTTLVQGVVAGWGSFDPVSSPTFVIVNVYRHTDGLRFFHLDAYRLNGSTEALELDLESMLDQGPMIVEWAERVQTVLPDQGLWVHLNYIDEVQRDLIFSARGQYYEELLSRFRKLVYGG
ncbi:MAG: tRNA (adenosine(37)-N6)-threonylcarbamoyltransferase complex ATPase subunit type 1 TsaE [Chloroflexi bacterium RBG_19FT_COMBO_50_10]|nr:MAG: tRNA (adenosine(37)-N6)-threonylcarbamoyltransferase complex ATPase subunit type 1 TsaE [Chloroflexi bacterium RBG_16_47_49]OGO66128.1 MAG: tRNA (adenosine(37)-N6)-threonylcarbamoyltransferase complex ATPase subunit type 1 TsaE [Chloroflexi bacterium RBG_19FT_COMBO_50_10]